jgi:hypothetical protein
MKTIGSYIGGKLVTEDAAQLCEIYNPATGKAIRQLERKRKLKPLN